MTLLPLYLLQMLYNKLISSKLYSINKYLLSIYSVSKLSVQFSCSVCLTLCDPMSRSTPGLPVHHYVPEFTQSHVHRVSDGIQPSHPLSSLSPLAPNPSQQIYLWIGTIKAMEIFWSWRCLVWTKGMLLMLFRHRPWKSDFLAPRSSM